MRHNITNINKDSATGDCSVCGTGVRLKPRGGKQAGTFRCYIKYMEQKQSRNYFGDGTPWHPGWKAAMLEEQGYKCKICLDDINMSTAQMDHCHTELVVRGLLCRNCNLGLGYFRDSQEHLQNAINYLNIEHKHVIVEVRV